MIHSRSGRSSSILEYDLIDKTFFVELNVRASTCGDHTVTRSPNMVIERDRESIR